MGTRPQHNLLVRDMYGSHATSSIYPATQDRPLSELLIIMKKNGQAVAIGTLLTDQSLTITIPLELLADGQERIFSVQCDKTTLVRLIDGISDDTFEQYRLNLLTPCSRQVITHRV